MAAISGIDSLNKDCYLSEEAAQWYASKNFVLEEESAFLRDFGSQMTGKALLDIGIGGGRSTAYLLEISSDYIGLDYSPAMVATVAKRWPELRLEVRDARDLSAYGDEQFDVVLFSFNGMDCLDHAGRLAVLKEVRRVLRPGGIYAFSSHNRASALRSPCSLSNLCWSKHPIRMCRNLGIYLRGIRSWWSSRHLAVEEKQYAMRHDSGTDFTAPLYYISKAGQQEQLAEAGYKLEAIYDRKGKRCEVAEADGESAWIFYVGRKLS
jgi:SAM-dependent methyltransferase